MRRPRARAVGRAPEPLRPPLAGAFFELFGAPLAPPEPWGRFADLAAVADPEDVAPVDLEVLTERLCCRLRSLSACDLACGLASLSSAMTLLSDCRGATRKDAARSLSW